MDNIFSNMIQGLNSNNVIKEDIKESNEMNILSSLLSSTQMKIILMNDFNKDNNSVYQISRKKTNSRSSFKSFMPYKNEPAKSESNSVLECEEKKTTI